MNSTQTERETYKLDMEGAGEKLKELIHEGNIRRITVKRGDEVIAEFPLTAAVVGAVVAPVLAAIGAIAALVANCSIEVERTDEAK